MSDGSDVIDVMELQNRTILVGNNVAADASSTKSSKNYFYFDALDDKMGKTVTDGCFL